MCSFPFAAAGKLLGGWIDGGLGGSSVCGMWYVVCGRVEGLGR